MSGVLRTAFRLSLSTFVALAFTGCDRQAVKKRADAIRERNARLDQVSKVRVMQEVRKKWAIRGDAWFGKLRDGSLIRLDCPTVTVTPVKMGKPFCCNWLGEVAVIADRWRSHPRSDSSEPFTLLYQAVMESADRYVLTAVESRESFPPTENEVAVF